MAIEEAVVEDWLVAVGDAVSEGQDIVVVATDKANTSLASPYTGVVREIHAESGEDVGVGALLATFEA